MKSPASSLRFATFLALALGGLAIVPAPIFGQHPESAATSASPDALPVFDLDFPGGTPAELVAAISKASGQTLNAIIAPEYAAKQLPPIKVKGVNAAQLFGTLSNVQRGPVTRMNQLEYHNRSSFMTDDGSPSSRSIWYFAVGAEQPRESVKTRFFSLARYLQSGVTVDDITTAVRTGWEMRGDSENASLKFHQETQILIAVGGSDQLDVINEVLEALSRTIAVREETSQRPAAHAEHAH